jgi:hypothetical protein
MKHKNMSLAIAAFVAAVAMTTVAFAIPQQAFAHYGHHNSNSIDVSQDITQVNQCTGNGTTCANVASNDAHIHR